MTINGNTTFVAPEVRHFEQLDSTNEYAMEWIATEAPPEGSIVITDYQSHGRGQYGTQWQVKPNSNLTFSIILYPKQHIKYSFGFQMLAAVATLQAIAPFATSQIKWPNDLVIGHKKVAGILNQAAIQGQSFQYMIIGIGLNVLQRNFSTLPHATSLRNEAPSFSWQKASIPELALAIHQQVGQLYSHWDYASIKAAYCENLAGVNQQTPFNLMQGETFLGQIIDVTSDGYLIVATAQGKRTIKNKEAKYWY